MELEVVYGESRNRAIANSLVGSLRAASIDGTIYLGYPVLASADEPVHIDALLISPSHGLVAFQLGEGVPRTPGDWQKYAAEQDKLYGVLESHLGRHESLRIGRRLGVDIKTVTVFPSHVERPAAVSEGYFCGLDESGPTVATFNGLDARILRALQAALQRVTTIKPPKKRTGVQLPNSRGAILKEIEKNIANLDRWQNRAAIETPDGPQRVRGLAGSGKTIVLALKAAYLHAQHPDWLIAVTFQTRSLYQQIQDLVTRFSFEHSNDKPDFERLRLLHAWGGADRDGVYTTIARASGAVPRDFAYGKATYGMANAFQGVCQELLQATSNGRPQPIFDAVLIDEAQDLPPEFFRLVYRFTSQPKRIVWAYDELQKLSEAAMPSTKELFGVDENGEDLVSLATGDGEPRRDVILRVCYRNSPWALATAHALGLGIYRQHQSIVQHFDEPGLWTEIGYKVVNGELTPGKMVTLERDSSSYPAYFPHLLKQDDAVSLLTFSTAADQDEWVAAQIKRNITEDELEIDDILIVLPDAITAKARARTIVQALARQDVSAHLAGVTSSRDEMFRKESIAIAHIFRAKGNEAPMVYVMDSQHGVHGPNLITRRNTLFTAMTRSRAWVRICGWGPQASALEHEVQKVREYGFRLKFRVPTSEELARLRKIHRDRTEAELASIKRATQGLSEFLKAVEREEIDLESLSPALRTRLALVIREDPNDEGEQS